MEETSCIKQVFEQIDNSLFELKRIVEEPSIEQLKRIVSDLTRVREIQEAEIAKLKDDLKSKGNWCAVLEASNDGYRAKFVLISEKVTRLTELDDIAKSEGGYLAFSEYRYYLQEIASCL